MPRTTPGRPRTFMPWGVSDAIDGSSSPPGSLAKAQNLVPSPLNRLQWVPRPAAALTTSFPGFTMPAQGEALITVGEFAYGIIASGRFAGQSEPFCYHFADGVFHTISNVTATNTPTTQPTTGDWTVPTIAVVGTRILFTHPGFSGANFIGWLDISGFSDNAHTVSTHSNTTIDTFSAGFNPLTGGYQVGFTVSGAGIPAGTTITAITATTITISQAATTTAGGVAITVSGGTQAAPLWGAGDTNHFSLGAVATCVANFNGRAFYGVGNSIIFSDQLSALQISNTSTVQQLNPANGLAITGFGPIGLYQTQGGILQAILAFQGDQQIQQITGDLALSNLSMQAMDQGVGTLAPNTITPTPIGLSFVAPDGLRFVDSSGRILGPIGVDGDGVSAPFINAVSPSRMCSAFNQNVLRISVQNGAAAGEPVQEWWYHFNSKVWSGPHTFTAALIAPTQVSNGSVAGQGHGFLFFPSTVTGQLWEGDPIPTVASSYTENGAVLTWDFMTTLSQDEGELEAKAMSQTTWGLALPPQSTITVIALNETADVLDTVTVAGPQTSPAVWGQFNWGQAKWGATSGPFYQRVLPWTKPLVYNQIQFQASGTSVAGLTIGKMSLLERRLGIPAIAPARFTVPVPPSTGAITTSGTPGVTDTGERMQVLP